MGGVDLLNRFISQYRPTFQAKKWYWPLFVNCIEMLTVAAWRLHVNFETSSRLDFLEFIQSVVGSFLKTSNSESSGPNERIIINTKCWSAPTCQRENSRTLQKNTIKNVMLACILCASWSPISNKILPISGIFVVVSCHLECFRNRKCLQRRQRSEIFLRNVSW